MEITITETFPDKFKDATIELITNCALPYTLDVLFSYKVTYLWAGDSLIAMKPELQEPTTMCVMIALGDLEVVSQLFKAAKNLAKNLGCKKMSYCGRRGWIRAENFTESFVYAYQNI